MPEATQGRRELNRVARNHDLLLAATEIIATEGVEGLTMTAVADNVGCAVGTIYTYFDSKSGLLAALQVNAIQTLIDTFTASAESWEHAISKADLDPAVAALARLVAIGQIFVAAGDIHEREFDLLQMLISAPADLTTDSDRQDVIPLALELLDTVRVFIDLAILVGALSLPSSDSSVSRAVRWAGGINGALLVSNVGIEASRKNPTIFDGQAIALSLAQDLLRGWGAPLHDLEAANLFVDHLIATDQLVALRSESIIDLTRTIGSQSPSTILTDYLIE
ncbi:MAG: helix-turn-helix domain containing protein [Actinobacteria bacterium]|nr:helix-turn-helix domain containing protein [Actinomycetota bacterium]